MNIRYYFLTPPLYPIFCLTVSLILGIMVQSLAPQLFIHFCICCAIISFGLLGHKKSFLAHPVYIALYLSAYCFGSFSYYKTLETQTTFCAYVQGKCFNLTGIVTDIRRIPQSHMRYSVTMHLTSICPTQDLTLHNADPKQSFQICLFVKVIVPFALRSSEARVSKGNYFKKSYKSKFLYDRMVRDALRALTTNGQESSFNDSKIKAFSCEYPNTHHENIALYCTELHGIHVADTIQVHDVQFRRTANQEFMHYLLKEHITTSAVLNENEIDLIKRPTYSWSRFLHEYRNKLLHKFRRSMNKETFFAFASIFLGDPFAKKKEETLKGQLKTWGLFHYIARAGLHLVIFVSIWMFILSLLPVSWFLRQLLMILLCSVYFMLTWPSIPFNRAFFTLLLVRTSGLVRLKTYSVPALLLVACATLIASPFALFALDFQLSFGVTFGLAWLNEMRYRRYSFPATIAGQVDQKGHIQ